MLLDVAYVYEYGEYYLETGNPPATISTHGRAAAPATQRNALTTNRVFASIIYRFNPALTRRARPRTGAPRAAVP